MATKFGTKLTITWLVYEISARPLCICGGFGGWASECCQSNSKPTDPRCNENKIWNKMGFNSTFMYEIFSRFLYLTRGFEGEANK